MNEKSNEKKIALKSRIVVCTNLFLGFCSGTHGLLLPNEFDLKEKKQGRLPKVACSKPSSTDRRTNGRTDQQRESSVHATKKEFTLNDQNKYGLV